MRLGTAGRDPWVWGQLVLVTLVLAGAPWVGRRLGVVGHRPRLVVAGLVLALGIAVVVRGVADLGRSLTPATQPLPEGVLVTTGIYGLVRHPIYLGLILVMGAWTLGAAGWLAGACVSGAALAFFDGKARVEERWMQARFPGYAQYARTTPRLIPLGWKQADR